MFTKKNVVEIYAEFLKEVNLKFDKKVLHFEDVPAVLYIKDYVLGLENKQSIKYLLIDEMQDYSPIHYDIINKLFDCNKLILGDINQNILNVYTRDDLVKITNQIGECNLAELTKTYRPTYEISKFCQMIKNLNYEVVDRHGKPVEILLFNNKQDELNKIMEIFKLSDKRIALICKTDEEAKEYFSLLKNVIKDISLIVEEKEQVGSKLVISSTNSKGIEFDVVIIPNVSEENYSDELDCNILYVSATRALHELYLTSTGKMSKLIDKKLDN
jgi:DNA helicase-2/ATP-dependent DNA helicase PcrA